MARREVIPTRRAVLAGGGVALAAPFVLHGSTGVAEARSAFKGAASPLFHRFRLGGFEITVLSDASAMVDGPWPIVGEDRPRDEVEALMRQNLLPPNRFRPGFSPILIDTGRESVLIDAGNGAEGFIPRPAGGRLAACLEAAGVRAEDIDVVAITHCHTDHIGGLMEGGRPQFPNATYVVGAAEYAFWNDEARLKTAPDGNEFKSARLFARTMPQLAGRTRFIKPGEEVVAGVTAIAAFGHTPGHLAFHVESEGKRLLAWGDCAHHEVASLAHPEWSALFDMDKEAGRATRARIYDMATVERLPVIGYHTSFPSLGYVMRAGTAYRWLPETYQLAE